MNLEIASLVALFLAIVLGFLRKSNVGIISIGFAMVIGLIYKVDPKEIMDGFSSSLFLQMVGITFLFSIINENGTLAIFANAAVKLVGKKKFLIPVVMFVIGFILCGVGPGAIPTLAIMPVLAVPVAISAGLNPIMVALIGQMGAESARMSGLTPEAAVVRELMEAQGLNGNTHLIGLCLLITEIALALITYIYYKGWQITEPAMEKNTQNVNIKRSQVYSIVGLLIMLVGVLFFSWNTGLTGFLIGSILVMIGAGSEKKGIANIPWNVILMVIGVGILMNIITVSGGIDVMVAGMQKIMGPNTAVPCMAIASGVMSLFSSGLGVVFPTLIPTASALASHVDVSAIELVSVIVIGGTVSGFSPVSTAGALVMAAVSQNQTTVEKHPQNKIFIELFGIALVALLITVIFSLIGIYGWIV